MKRLAKSNNPIIDVGGLAFTHIFTMLTSIGQTMILSRSLNKFDYGTYSQVLIIIQITTTISAFGLNSAVNYFLSQKSNLDWQKEYFNSIFSLNLITGLFGSIVLLLFRNNIGMFFKNQSLGTLMLYVAFRPMITNLITDFHHLFIVNSKTKFLSARNIIIGVIQVLIIGLTAILRTKIKTILLLLVLLDIGQLIYFFFLTKGFWFSVRIITLTKKRIIEILTFSAPMALALMVGTLNIQTGKLVIGHFFNTEQLAEYANMSKELPFSFIALALNSVMLPKIIFAYKNNNKDLAKQLWSTSITIGWIFTSVFCFAALLLPREIISILYSSKYVSGEPIFRIFIIAQLIRFTYFGTILNASGKTRSILLYSIVSFILNIILSIVFYQLIGYPGPAYATVVSIGLLAILQLFHSAKLLNCSILDLVNIKLTGSFLLLLSLMLLVFSAIKNLLYTFDIGILQISVILGGLFILISLSFFRKPIKDSITRIGIINKSIGSIEFEKSEYIDDL